MYVLSIDSATKSLGVSVVSYNLSLADDIEKEFNLYLNHKKNNTFNERLENFILMLKQVNKILDNKLQLHYLNVIDLIPNKKVNDVSVQDRTKALHNYLTDVIDPIIQSKDNWLFLLEFQMGPNTKSNIISSQLMYHLSKYNHKIELVGPSLKNKIIIGDISGGYENFAEKYQTSYAANKMHSRHNFLKLLKNMKKESMIKDIKKKNIDDIADSVLQGLSYMIKHHGF